MDGAYTNCAILDDVVFLDKYDRDHQKLGKTIIHRMSGEVFQYDAEGALFGKGKGEATTSPYVERRKF